MPVPRRQLPEREGISRAARIDILRFEVFAAQNLADKKAEPGKIPLSALFKPDQIENSPDF